MSNPYPTRYSAVPCSLVLSPRLVGYDGYVRESGSSPMSSSRFISIVVTGLVGGAGDRTCVWGVVSTTVCGSDCACSRDPARFRRGSGWRTASVPERKPFCVGRGIALSSTSGGASAGCSLECSSTASRPTHAHTTGRYAAPETLTELSERRTSWIRTRSSPRPRCAGRWWLRR